MFIFFISVQLLYPWKCIFPRAKILTVPLCLHLPSLSSSNILTNTLSESYPNIHINQKSNIWTDYYNKFTYHCVWLIGGALLITERLNCLFAWSNGSSEAAGLWGNSLHWPSAKWTGRRRPWMACLQVSEETPNAAQLFLLLLSCCGRVRMGFPCISVPPTLPAFLTPSPPCCRQLHILNFCNRLRAGLFLPLANEILEFMGFVFLISELLVSAQWWAE